MKKSKEYFEELSRVMTQVRETQEPAIDSAASAVAETLLNGGTVFTFGTGHSHILAEEIFYRAGGLVKVYPLLDSPLMLHINASRSSNMERVSGYAETLWDGIETGANDVIFIFSNSGRNAVPVDMALAAKARGLKVICITNLKHTRSVSSRHPAGKKLFEVSDIVIDNCGAIGDAAISVGEYVCGPTSTAVGAAVLQSIVCGAVEKVLEAGRDPEVFKSSNVDGGDAVNEAFIEKYKKQIRIL